MLHPLIIYKYIYCFQKVFKYYYNLFVFKNTNKLEEFMKNKIFVASLIGAGLLLADETKLPTSSESKNLTSQFLDGIETKGFARARYTTIDGAGESGAD